MSLRFGLIGLGYHGKAAVLPAFYHPDATAVTLNAVCDAKQEALDAVENPVEKYSSINDMLDNAPIDAVYLAAGMNIHCELAIAALKAGKHVICEKPMSDSLEKCRRMIETAKNAGKLLVVNFETRYGQKNSVLKRWLADNRFGRVDAIHFTNMWDGHKNFGPVRERRARLISMAGALDCGIHKLDQARFLLGGNWQCVHAVGAWLNENFNPPPHIGIIGTLDSGPMVTLNASLAFAAAITPRPMVDNLYVVGTDGVAIINTDILGQHTVCELSSKSLCEKVEFDEGGHSNDIAKLLSEVAAVAINGPNTPHSFATGEDGYQAQLATDLANNDAIKNRVK